MCKVDAAGRKEPLQKVDVIVLSYYPKINLKNNVNWDSNRYILPYQLFEANFSHTVLDCDFL